MRDIEFRFRVRTDFTDKQLGEACERVDFNLGEDLDDIVDAVRTWNDEACEYVEASAYWALLEPGTA